MLASLLDPQTDKQETVEKSEEEIAAALERRREQGKRLQEMQSKQRAEKVNIDNHSRCRR